MSENLTDDSMSTVSEWIEKYGADVLTERSLSRLIKHIRSDKSFALLSAWRHEEEVSYKENWDNNTKLQKEIRSLGFGATKMKGVYYELDKQSGQSNSYRGAVLVRLRNRNEGCSQTWQKFQAAFNPVGLA